MQGDAGWELGLRLMLAAVFAVAAVGKSMDREGTRAAVARFGLRGPLAAAGAFAVPAIEAVLAVGLVVGATARWAAAGSVLVLGAFSVALLRARDEDCGCFGALGDQLDVQPLWRNAVLSLAAVAVAVSVPWLSVAAAVVAVAGLATVLVRTWRRTSFNEDSAAARGTFGDLSTTTVHRSPNAPLAGGGGVGRAAAGAPARTPDVGTVAPTFALPSSAGGFVTLPDLLLADRPVLLVFSAPDCRPCDGVPARVARWRRELGDRLTVAVVTREPVVGSADPAAASADPVLLQREWEVARAYGAGHMPSGLLVGADGRIASQLAVGDLDIERLLDAELAREAPVVAAPAAPDPAAASRPAPVTA